LDEGDTQEKNEVAESKGKGCFPVPILAIVFIQMEL
jgi:hypothetical protein